METVLLKQKLLIQWKKYIKSHIQYNKCIKISHCSYCSLTEPGTRSSCQHRDNNDNARQHVMTSSQECQNLYLSPRYTVRAEFLRRIKRHNNTNYFCCRNRCCYIVATVVVRVQCFYLKSIQCIINFNCTLCTVCTQCVHICSAMLYW